MADEFQASLSAATEIEEGRSRPAMTNGSDRLDRIEAILQQSAIASDDRMVRLEQSMISSDERMTRLEQSMIASDERMTRLEQAIADDRNQMTIGIQTLSATVNQLATEAREDRVIMYEMLDQLVTVRDENQRILEYLFGQQRGNGHNDQPQP